MTAPGESAQIGMRIAVVIPCYRVRKHICSVLEAIPAYVEAIYVVDDKCPENTGDFVESHSSDERVIVIRNAENMGVGGSVMNGYRKALADGLDIVVKIDGDGQMDPALLPKFISPILRGEADYTKGNRFYDVDGLSGMPRIRLFGNAILSLLSKLSSGYWDIFDPTNGYTAIHRSALERLRLDKISRRYFFETDMLFRLGLVRAVVRDVPMGALYGSEDSGLKVRKIVGEFFAKHMRNYFKRIVYMYFLRDFSVASIELVAGSIVGVVGISYGTYQWILSSVSGHEASAGTVMLAALSILVSFQLLLAFLNYDMTTVPRSTLQR